jgi:glycerol-3-phosphate dehydrogenase
MQPPASASYPDRSSVLSEKYDLAVIGGGIHGAATLWEAASRGMRAILIEKADFAAGTSANSLKVVHGGLRNLQRFDFAGMRHYIRARRELLRIAPHLVRPMAFYLPTYAKLMQSRLAMTLALELYDLVGWDRSARLQPERRLPASHTLSAAALRHRIPGYDDPAISGAACWYDAQVQNSERLVLAYVLGAVGAGAAAVNHVEAVSIFGHQGRVHGVRVRDRLDGGEFEIKTDAVVDCRGPWVQRGLSEKAQDQPIWKSWAKAVNLVIRREIAPEALGFKPRRSSGALNRYLFTVPWRGGNILGTWYYRGGPDSTGPGLSEGELESCLAQVNSRFPEAHLGAEDVSLVHCGWLPAMAAAETGPEPGLLPKATILSSMTSNALAGIFTVIGVKLTNSGAVARDAIDQVAGFLGKSFQRGHPPMGPLYSADFESWADFQGQWMRRLGGQYPAAVIERLNTNYGSKLSDIMALTEGNQDLADRVPGTDAVLKAEVEFVLQNEMTYTLSDLVLRRTDIGCLERPSDETVGYCADRLGDYWGWDQKTRDENVQALAGHYPPWS